MKGVKANLEKPKIASYQVLPAETTSMMQARATSRDLQLQRTAVEQLRREAKVQRMKISQCAGDILQYCEQKQMQDPLVNAKLAHSSPIRNPNKTCIIL